jgi:hypothetical protein
MIFQLYFPTVSVHVKDGTVTAAAPLTAPFGIDSDVSGSADDRHMGTVAYYSLHCLLNLIFSLLLFSLTDTVGAGDFLSGSSSFVKLDFFLPGSSSFVLQCATVWKPEPRGSPPKEALH